MLSHNSAAQKQFSASKVANSQNADLANTFSQDIQMKATMDAPESIQLNDSHEREMLRLISQYLHDHNYSAIAKELENHSNVKMEDESVYDFKQAVLSGNYTAARSLVSARSDEPWSQKVLYLLWEQSYMEHIESGKRLEAVNILQKEMMTRIDREDETSRNRIHGLAQLLMVGATYGQDGVGCKAIQQELRRLVPMWKGSGSEGRTELLAKIQSIMPASEMLQPKRLENLMKQAMAYQFFNCKYHNVSTYGPQTGFSLLEDHICDKQSMIPTKCIGILTKHRDEVWQVKFSPSGQKIATIGKDNLIYIWSLSKSSQNQQGSMNLKSQNSGINTNNKYRIKCTHEIKGHSKQINSIAWSSDDKWIVTASHDQTAKVWDAQRSGKLIVEITRHQEAISSASFLINNNNESTKLITAAVDKLIILWDIRVASSHTFGESSSGPFIYEAVELARIESRNYLDMAVAQNRFVLMGKTHFQVFTYQSSNDLLEVLNDRDIPYEYEIQDEPMTSIAISRNGRYLLANMSFKAPKLEVYDLGVPTEHGSRKCELVRRLKGGHDQTQFILRCCFGGGSSEQFVLCGSEDTSIALWHKEKGEIIARVSGGHTQMINSVSWSPSDAQLFLTASDDHTVRLWATENTPQAEIITESKDLKKIDSLKTGAPSSRIYMAGLHSEEYQSDSSDEENRVQQQNYEDEEEAMEDDEQMIFRPIQSTRVLQATRVLPSGIREEEVEDDEEEEEDDDWAMSGGSRRFH